MPAEPTVVNKEMEGAVLVWENNLGKPGRKLRSSVDLAFNYVALEGDENVYCINSAGKVLWKYQIPAGISDIKSSLEGKYVAVSSNNGGMFYLDNTGKLLWSYSLGKSVPVQEVSPDGSTVVATTIPPSGKGNTLCILSKAGQVLRHLSTPYEVKTVGLSFDGNVIITGDANHNVAQYTKTGDRQWLYSIHAPIGEVKVSQSGLLIFARTSDIVSISPSGTERWKVKIPDGPVSSIKMSQDGSVGMACGSGAVIRYDLKGKILWKHPMPGGRRTFALSYRSYNIVFLASGGMEFWDKYGYAISSFPLPNADQTSEDCMATSTDGRYLIALDQTGVIRQMDVGKVLARHLIEAGKIFMDELKRLGTITPGSEENLQWAIESMNDGDVQNALIFGTQAYTGMEATLDSMPTRKPETAPAAAASAAAQQTGMAGPAMAPARAAELYKKGLKEIFSVKEEPSEIEWNLLTILREAFSITPEQHDRFEEEVKGSLKAAPAAPSAPSIAPRTTSVPDFMPVEPGPKTTSVPDFMSSVEPKTTSVPDFTPVEPSPNTTSVPDFMPSVEPRTTSVPDFTPEEPGPKTTSVPDFSRPSVEPAPTPPFDTPAPAPPAPSPPTVEPAPGAPAPPIPASKPPETVPAQPAQAPAGNFSMDSYVSDILGKYLKK